MDRLFDKIEKLSPVAIMIIGTYINHVYRDNKDFTRTDLILLISPSIPSLLPVIMSIIKECCYIIYNLCIKLDIAMVTSTMVYLKETLPDFMSLFNFTSNKITPEIFFDDFEQNKNEEIECNNNCVDVQCDIQLIQLLIQYAMIHSDECTFDEVKNNEINLINLSCPIIHKIISNVTFNHKTEENKDIKIIIPYISYKYTIENGNYLIKSFSFKTESNNDIKKFTRFTDFFENKKLSKTIKDISDKIIFRLFEDCNIDEYFQTHENSYENTVMEVIKQSCPKINKLQCVTELNVMLILLESVLSQTIKKSSSNSYSELCKAFSVTLNSVKKYKISNCEIKCKKINQDKYSFATIFNKLKIPEDKILEIINKDIMPLTDHNFTEIVVFINSVYRNQNIYKQIKEDKTCTLQIYMYPETTCPNVIFKNAISTITDKISMLKTDDTKVNIVNLTIVNDEIEEKQPNPEYEKYQEMQGNISQLEKDDPTSEELKKLKENASKQPIPEKEISSKIINRKISSQIINSKYKNLNTLYLGQQDMHNLQTMLNNFKNKKEFYETFGLPNKLGILLHGEPGTGKSSTIQAIASYLQKDIYYANMSTVTTNQELQNIFDHVNDQINGGIVVFEDIDAMTDIVNDRKKLMENTESVNGELTLEYFLNILQGSLTKDGTIFIATTNHIEKLDQAFIRIGRFDIKICMKKCDHYQIECIYKKFTGKKITSDTLMKIEEYKHTPAEIIFHLIDHVDSEHPDTEIMKKFINV
jgi:SpoVK/Ycf46/Vps4 family AAA+-type ATPase